MARDIILRETDRGWLPIIRQQQGAYSEWRELYRGEFRATTGEALEYAERALDELDITAAEKPPWMVW